MDIQDQTDLFCNQPILHDEFWDVDKSNDSLHSVFFVKIIHSPYLRAYQSDSAASNSKVVKGLVCNKIWNKLQNREILIDGNKVGGRFVLR